MSEDKASLQKSVTDYLLLNPSFLREHPEILEALQLDHNSGLATSLIERQVSHLREKNQELSQQLKRLVQVASENEQLMSRLHRLTLKLMAINNAADFFGHLGQSLLEDFKADVVQICLFKQDLAALAGENVSAISQDDPDFQQFRAQLDKNHTICGRLNIAKLEFLFASKGRWVQSTALVPLGEQGADGMMAIGSSDPARFYPGMGTLFLDLLSDVISTSIANTLPEELRRSA